jgi:hypothetical protein
MLNAKEAEGEVIRVVGSTIGRDHDDDPLPAPTTRYRCNDGTIIEIYELLGESQHEPTNSDDSSSEQTPVTENAAAPTAMPNDEAEPRSEQAKALGGGKYLDECSEREREEAEEARVKRIQDYIKHLEARRRPLVRRRMRRWPPSLYRW